MSISDRIVVMKDGIIRQIGKPQEVYDDPHSLFVAKFLGTPSINVFEGRIEGGAAYIGEERVGDAKGLSDGRIHIAIRPEGLRPDADGPLTCALSGVEVMGRDVSIVATHPACSSPIRAIVPTELSTVSATVRFAIKPDKLFYFDGKTEERLYPNA